jgi:hypothetical protein
MASAINALTNENMFSRVYTSTKPSTERGKQRREVRTHKKL